MLRGVVDPGGVLEMPSALRSYGRYGVERVAGKEYLG